MEQVKLPAPILNNQSNKKLLKNIELKLWLVHLIQWEVLLLDVKTQ